MFAETFQMMSGKQIDYKNKNTGLSFIPNLCGNEQTETESGLYS